MVRSRSRLVLRVQPRGSGRLLRARRRRRSRVRDGLLGQGLCARAELQPAGDRGRRERRGARRARAGRRRARRRDARGARARRGHADAVRVAEPGGSLGARSRLRRRDARRAPRRARRPRRLRAHGRGGDAAESLEDVEPGGRTLRGHPGGAQDPRARARALARPPGDRAPLHPRDGGWAGGREGAPGGASPRRDDPRARTPRAHAESHLRLDRQLRRRRAHEPRRLRDRRRVRRARRAQQPLHRLPDPQLPLRRLRRDVGGTAGDRARGRAEDPGRDRSGAHGGDPGPLRHLRGDSVPRHGALRPLGRDPRRAGARARAPRHPTRLALCPRDRLRLARSRRRGRSRARSLPPREGGGPPDAAPVPEPRRRGSRRSREGPRRWRSSTAAGTTTRRSRCCARRSFSTSASTTTNPGAGWSRRGTRSEPC